MNNEIAQALIKARQGGPLVPSGVAPSPTLTHEDSYDIQRQVADIYGPPGGFKFAHRSGQPADMAPIFANDILESGSLSPSGGAPVGIELEVGFRILYDLPDPASPNFRNELRQCVAPLAVIELVQTRLQDHATAGAALKLADNQMNNGLVIGDCAQDWDGGQLFTVTACLQFDGKQILDGSVALPFGDGFDCLVSLAKMVGTHCGGLRAGHVVITGSLNGLPYVPPGTKVRGSIAGVGDVAIDIAD